MNNFAFSIACIVVFLVAVAPPTAGVLQPGDSCPTNEIYISRVAGHPGYYARDETDCQYGYRCNKNGVVIKVLSCVEEDPNKPAVARLFYSLKVKTCATFQTLAGEEDCDNPSGTSSLPSGFTCDQGAEGDFENPNDCASFIKCSVSADPHVLKCGSEFDAFVQSEGRCVTPSSVPGRSSEALCGSRPANTPVNPGSAFDCNNLLTGLAAKTDGLSRCGNFYFCALQEFVFNCAPGSVFSNSAQTCVWPGMLTANERAACGRE